MLLPNPWLILAGVLLLGTAYITGDLRGAKRGSDAVQVKWDRETAQRALRTAENVQRSRDTQDKLQEDADASAKQTAATITDLDARLRDAVISLSNRPDRPGPGADPKTASACTQGSGTGVGLYRSDALFLTRLADTAQRVRVQRDECYDAYGRAQEALDRLSRAQGANSGQTSPSNASPAQ